MKNDAHNQVVKTISAFNKTTTREKDKIKIKTSIIFSIGCILARKKYIEESPHSKKEFIKYQNEISKVLKLQSNEKKVGVDRIVFSNSQGQKVGVSSKLFIDTVLTSLDPRHAKKSKGGKPENVLAELCRQHIETLKEENVPMEFISSLLNMSSETLERTLRRKRTIPPSE